MTYEPTPGRRVLLLRPAKYAVGDGYGAFGPDGNRLVEYWKAHGAETCVREIKVTAPDDHDPATPPSRLDMRVRFKRLLGDLAALPSAMPHVSPFDTLVIACHGWRTGLQLGITASNVGVFADALIGAGLTEDAVIFIAACSAGSGAAEGDRSVADALRDALAARGRTHVAVYAHTTAGMAFRNPYVRVFRGNGSATPLEGGAYFVNPKSLVFPKWRKKMTQRTEPGGGFLWCRFFDMMDEEISEELGA